MTDLTRDGVKRWLLDVLKATGETPTALARRAGIAQSTLTRFLGPDDGPMLSLTTISKIAHVTGITPDGFAAMPAHELRLAGMSEREAEPIANLETAPTELQQALRALTAGRNAADVWILRTHALAWAGYLPGDYVVVDLGLRPDAGDIVCAQHYSWASSTAETIFRIYEPPYLVAAGSAPDLRRPLVVDGERVIVKGVVTALLRPR